jgi:hypothetical protein
MIIFSPRVKDVITYSKEEALRLGHDFIGTEHLIQVREMEMEKQSDFKQSRY